MLTKINYATLLVQNLKWFHGVIITLSLLLTLFAWQYSTFQVQQKVEDRFKYQANQIVQLLFEQMERYQEALIAGAAALNVIPGDADYAQWKRFSEGLSIEQLYPGVNGIGVIHYRKKHELAKYLAWQRELRPEYEIHPTHDNDEFWPITYIEPLAINEKAVGLDIAHERNRHEAAINARDSGVPKITGPITLVQDASKTPGFLFFVPFYRSSVIPDTYTGRIQQFRGLVYAPFIMEKLMRGTLANKDRLVHFSIADSGSSLYNEFNDSSVDYDPKPMLTKEMEVSIHGRKWVFNIATTQSFRQINTTHQPYYILVGGIVVDIMLVLLFLTLSIKTRHATDYAENLTKELKEKNIQLEKTYTRLNGALNTMIDGLVVISGKGIILEVNIAVLKLFGYTREQLIGHNVSLLMPAEYCESHDNYLENYQATGQAKIIGDLRKLEAIKANGVAFPISLSVTEAIGNGEVFYTGVIHDLSAIEASRVKLIETEQVLKSALHKSGSGFFIENPQGELVDANKAMASWLGYSESDFMKLKIEQIVSEQYVNELHEQRASMQLGEKAEYSGEVLCSHKDGHSLWGLLFTSAVKGESNDILFWVSQIIDIDGQKTLEEILSQKNIELVKSNKDLAQFAYAASHDLKAPLRAIKQLSLWIEEDVEDPSEDVVDHINTMRARVNRMEMLLEDLLQYSRIGQQQSPPETLLLESLFDSVINLFLTVDSFTYSVESEVKSICAHKAPLEQVLRNLIGNAIKHNVNSEKNIIICVKDCGEFLEFKIQDNGSGVPEKYHKDIFNLFRTLRPRDEVEGSGMGLAIVQKTIIDNGGSIYLVKDKDLPPGIGCCFIFTWKKLQPG